MSISTSGVLLLAFRETAALGILLALHLGLAMALFVTLPYENSFTQFTASRHWSAFTSNAADRCPILPATDSKTHATGIF